MCYLNIFKPSHFTNLSRFVESNSYFFCYFIKNLGKNKSQNIISDIKAVKIWNYIKKNCEIQFHNNNLDKGRNVTDFVVVVVLQKEQYIVHASALSASDTNLITIWLERLYKRISVEKYEWELHNCMFSMTTRWKHRYSNNVRIRQNKKKTHHHQRQFLCLWWKI